MTSKRTNLNRNVASQARMMPLMRCCVLSFGRIEGKPQEGGERNQADNEPAQEDGFGHGVCARNKRALYSVVFQTSANQAIIRFI